MFIRPKTPEIIVKRRRFWRRTRVIALWSLAVGFVLHSGLNIYASVLLNRELAAIRRKGEPLTIAELAPPALPDAQNAALIYARAAKALHLSRREEAAFRVSESNRSPQESQLVEAALGSNQATLDLTRRAAAMPQCRFALDWTTPNPMSWTFPHYKEMRELARLLGAEARLESKSGDGDAALRDVRGLFGMARHLSNEPSYTGFMVAQTLDALAHQTLAQVIETRPLTATQAQSFAAALPKTDWNRAFRFCLLSERAWGNFIFRAQQHSDVHWNIDSIGSNQTLWSFFPFNVLWSPMLKLDQVQYLRLWKMQFDTLSDPRLTIHSKAALAGERAAENLPRYAQITRMLSPISFSASLFRDAAEVRRLQREIALSLAVYRIANGHYPAQLSEITSIAEKPLPLDPYSEKPFKYRREGESFLLYSVGLNQKDNSSKNSPLSPLDWQQDDLLWSNPFKGSFRLSKP